MDPDYAEFAAHEAGDPGLQMLLNDENRKKYGITEDEATTLKGVLFRRKGKGTLEQWLKVLWSIRELEWWEGILNYIIFGIRKKQESFQIFRINVPGVTNISVQY